MQGAFDHHRSFSLCSHCPSPSGPLSGISTLLTFCSTLAHGCPSGPEFANMNLPPSPFSSPLLLDLLVQGVAAVTDHYVRPGLLCLPSLSVFSYLPSPSPTNYMGWLTHKAEWRSALSSSSLARLLRPLAPVTSHCPSPPYSSICTNGF